MKKIPITQFRTKDGELTIGKGSFIAWDTIGGKHFEGYVEEMDSNVAIVELENGERIGVEC